VQGRAQMQLDAAIAINKFIFSRDRDFEFLTFEL
jgi:hypothetical protein